MYLRFKMPYLANEVQYQSNEVVELDEKQALSYILHGIAEKEPSQQEPKAKTAKSANSAKKEPKE